MTERRDPTPEEDPQDAIARLKAELAAALADVTTKQSAIDELRAQLVALNEAPKPVEPTAPTYARKGFFLEEVK